MSYEQATPDRITKVFIGGLKDLTEDDLRAHFSKYGEFSSERNGKPTTGIEVIKDKETNVPKFAFLHFKNVADCDSCIKANPHFVKNIKLMPRLAVNKDLNYALRQCEKEGQSGKLKVFIGGLPGSADEEKVKAALESHFSNLKVVKVIVKRTKEPERKPRGFGFLTLEDDHEVAKACEIRHFIIEGKQVECKLAPDNQQGGQGGGFGGGRGGGQDRGGFRGGYSQGGRGAGRGGASSWQQDSYGSTGGYGTGYDSWPGGNESYDNGSDYYAQDTTSYSGYSQNGGNGYNAGYNYDSTYGQSTASDYYGSGDGYGQSQGGYGAARGGGRGRGGASSYSSGRGAARGAGGRGGARGGGRGAPRHHPYQQQSY